MSSKFSMNVGGSILVNCYGENNFGFSVYSRNDALRIASEVLGREEAESLNRFFTESHIALFRSMTAFAKATSAISPGTTAHPNTGF